MKIHEGNFLFLETRKLGISFNFSFGSKFFWNFGDVCFLVFDFYFAFFFVVIMVYF